MKRAHKKIRDQLGPWRDESDASREVVIERLLQAIAREPIAIVTVVVDK